MTEEARDDAVVQWSEGIYWKTPDDKQAGESAFEDGFDAGVVEGRRQAREAVEAVYRDLVDNWLGAEAEGVDRARAAIGALGGEQ